MIFITISSKNKRKFIYNKKLYYWYISFSTDYDIPYIQIIENNRNLSITYKVNQINDDFICPKISIIKSNKLKSGQYKFSPPLEDEIITPKTISKILDWYEKQDTSISPIKYNWDKVSLTDINYKSGELCFINDDFENRTEDMLQVKYPNNYILDFGWYGSENGYIIFIIKDNNWDEPIKRVHCSYYSISEILPNAINFIEKISNY